MKPRWKTQFFESITKGQNIKKINFISDLKVLGLNKNENGARPRQASAVDIPLRSCDFYDCELQVIHIQLMKKLAFL